MRKHFVALAFLMLTPVLVSGGNFEFVVIGDTRPRFESESFRPFQGLITNINSLKPALVINLGDLIYGYGPLSKEHQWDKYQAVTRSIQVPYCQVPGNHDTHSKEARRIYARRFGRFYQSFDYGGCHFVLLDNTEDKRWGYLGPAQLRWLRNDLKQAEARSVFVFMHFPVWEPERITPAYHEFWLKTLHPLFKESRVRAVFGGHYHTYGPTREFDGIRYFITGGGGAELRPDYRKSGGSHHFMRVKVSGDSMDSVDVRVVTEHGELTDPEADVMGGLQFAARNVSRIGIKHDAQELRAGVTFSVTVTNPYASTLTGTATWLMDASVFSVQPQSRAIEVPAGKTCSYDFAFRAVRAAATLSSLPQLEFNVASGPTRHRFHREVRFLQGTGVPYQQRAPVLDGEISEWERIPSLRLGYGTEPKPELRGCYDDKKIYLALCVPKCDDDEAKESGFSDELQIGVARRLKDSDFSGDLLRLGFNSDAQEARDRTPGHNVEAAVPGVKSASRTEGTRTNYEIAMPLSVLKGLRLGAGSRLVLDLAFPMPHRESETSEPAEPDPNTFAYRVRYGSDSLVPVYYVEMTLGAKP